MNATFRLRKAILYQGLAFTATFLIVTVAICSLFFLENPQAHGFKNGQSAARAACLGIAVFGFMMLIGVYYVLGYLVEQFSVEGTTIRIHSVFQNKEFDASSVREIIWNARTQGGKLILRTFSTKGIVHLHGFSNEDRLKIIRVLRRLIPHAMHTRWDDFCHFVALPLHEGRRSRQAGTVVPSDPLSLPESARVFVTRRRYDRLFAVIFPLSTVAAIIAWRKFAMPQVLGLLVYIVFFWALLRFTIPKEGHWRPKWAATPEGRIVGLSQLALPAMFLLMVGFGVAGLQREFALYLGVASLGGLCIVAMRDANKRQKLQRDRDAQEIAVSVERWNAAEQASFAAGALI